MTSIKHIITAGCILIAGTMAAQAPMLYPAGKARIQPSSRAASGEIIKEDFSRFTAGSETTPDAKNIADLRTGVIDAKYTAVPGWTGAAIYQAGGICAITTGMYSGENGPYEDTGFLTSPIGDYSGALTVTFRARLLDSAAEADAMAVMLGSTSAGRLEASTVSVTPQWQNFSVSFTKGRFEGCLIQWTMLKEKVLIDDITVTSVQTSIPAPVATAATNFTADGFTANWEPTDEAESYLLTVYERNSAEATTIVDFENLNLTADGSHIDADKPGFPEGWTFAYAAGTAEHVSDKGAGNSTGIVFDAKGEGFVTPVFDTPIRDFSFFARYPAGEPCFSKFKFSMLVGNEWQGLGNLDIERISPDGETINFSSRLPDGVRQIQVMFDENTANDAGKDLRVVIDDITIMTEPGAKAVITDRRHDSTSATVTGLDPEGDYSYTVKAANAQFTSEESNNMMATGLASPKLSLPEEVSADAYTARWEPSPKAQGYIVANYRVYTSPADGDVTMLYEDFSKVTEGTLDHPTGLYNTFNPLSLDEYTITPGWYGLCTYLVNGMLGTRSYFTAQGAIQTPAMNLSAAGGRFKVEMTIVADSDASEDMVVVQAGATEFKRMPIEDVMVPVKLVYEFDCGEAGMPLLIYTYQGMPFYIDEIKVTQSLPKGSQTFTEVENKTLTGKESSNVRFTGMEAAENENFAYRVTAFRNFYGSTIYSASPEAMHVLSTTGIDTVGGPAATEAYAEGLTLHINAAQPERIELYGVNGVKVAAVTVPEGHTTIALPSPGLYLLTGNQGTVAKIIAR